MDNIMSHLTRNVKYCDGESIMVEPQHSINIEIVRPDLRVVDIKGFLRFIHNITALDD